VVSNILTENTKKWEKKLRKMSKVWWKFRGKIHLKESSGNSGDWKKIKKILGQFGNFKTNLEEKWRWKGNRKDERKNLDAI